MNTFMLISSLAIIVEALVEYFGEFVPSHLKRFAAALVGVLLSIGYQADFIALLGYEAIAPIVGQVLTGLLIGRGANFINDFSKRLTMPKTPAVVMTTNASSADVSAITMMRTEN